MNKQEFLEMQAEFAEVVYSYERFLKDTILLDYFYNAAFYPLLKRIHYLETENVMLSRALSIIVRQEDQDYAQLIKEMKEKYANDLPTLDSKNKYSQILVAHVMANNKESKMAFEEEFKKFVKEHHPTVQALVSDEDRKLYGEFVPYYYEDNIDGFKKKFEADGNKFHEIIYPEEQYNLISQYYYDMRKNISTDYTKRSNQYPFNKRDTLVDEMAIARENGELKKRISDLITDNRKLHEDFVRNVGFDVALVDQPKNDTPAA